MTSCMSRCDVCFVMRQCKGSYRTDGVDCNQEYTSRPEERNGRHTGRETDAFQSLFEIIDAYSTFGRPDTYESIGGQDRR